MTTTIARRPRPVAPRLRVPSLAPIFRAAVHRRLAAIEDGAIELREGTRITRFGAAGASAVVITVHDDRFYGLVALGGGLGAAEAFIDGMWTASDLTALLRIFVRNMEAADAVESGLARLAAPLQRLAHLARRNTRSGSRRNIHAHYDLGNDFFELFLDETMTYSCGIFASGDSTMKAASIEKLDRLCRKLDLQPGDHVLEIGTGWGSFAIHAARTYGCRVTTTTISERQHALATERVKAAGLADRVEVLLRDYRDLAGRYDKLVSIEMIEAVGHDFLGEYFRTCHDRLKPGGRMALQAITMPAHRYDRYRRSPDFIQRYVFPGSCCPSVKAMVDAFGPTPLSLVHLEDITPHYAETLRRWRTRFFERIDAVRGLGCDDAFIRLWDYYLCYCEAGFAESYVRSVQMVLALPDGAERPG